MDYQAPNRSRRRQIFTAVLLTFAVAGGIVRWLAPAPSLARDMGSLLLVLWLPIVGNIIAWAIGRFHARRPQPPGFAPDRPFSASARVELTLRPSDVPIESRPVRAGLFPCLAVLGQQAFSARLRVLPGQEPAPGVPLALEIEFLRPELALPLLPPQTSVALLSGRTLLGQAVVLEHGAG